MGRQLILALFCALPMIAAAGADALPSERLAAGVYLFPGTLAEAAPDNGGRTGNLGVIIGDRGSLVVGTGSSDAHGEALLATVAQLTDKPVLLAVDVYAAPEHVLGNSAFGRHAVPVLAHRDLDTYMARHCEACLKRLAESTANAAIADTRATRPTRLVDGTSSIDLGDRVVDLIWFSGGPQPGVLAVFDRTSGVLFAGAIAGFKVVPDAHDADIDAWLAHLRSVQGMQPVLVVPGSGRPGQAIDLDGLADYLTALARDACTAYGKGASLAEATKGVPLPRFASWALYEERHSRNVHFEYLRCETRDLDGNLSGHLSAAPIGAATRAPARTD